MSESQIQAIKDVLDRAGFKPVEKAEITAESKAGKCTAVF